MVRHRKTRYKENGIQRQRNDAFFLVISTFTSREHPAGIGVNQQSVCEGCGCERIFKQIIAESICLFFSQLDVRYDFPHFHSFIQSPEAIVRRSYGSHHPSSVVDVVNVWKKNQSSVHRVYLIRFIDGFLERTMTDLFSPLTRTFFARDHSLRGVQMLRCR